MAEPSKKTAKNAAQAEALSYEQARDELLDVVRRLEAGGTTLEESLALWERGEALAGICQQWLDGARTRLDQARAATAGQAPTTTTGQPPTTTTTGAASLDDAEG